MTAQTEVKVLADIAVDASAHDERLALVALVSANTQSVCVCTALLHRPIIIMMMIIIIITIIIILMMMMMMMIIIIITIMIVMMMIIIIIMYSFMCY